MYQKQIKEYILAHQEEFLKDLAKLIAVDSVRGEEVPGKPYGEGPAKALDVFLELAAGYGFHTENWEYRVGFASFGPETEGRKLDITAHLDIIPVGEGWEMTEPLTMKVVDGKAYGRGTIDDKGPALAALYAMRAIRDLNIPLKEEMRLVVGCDEECGSSDMRYYYSRTEHAPMTFSPDADFPLINIEKGRFYGEISQAMTDDTIVELQGGMVINAVPSNCRAAVCGVSAEAASTAVSSVHEATGTDIAMIEEDGLLKISVSGTNAHASTPEGGNNAITAMLQLLGELPLGKSVVQEKIRALSALFPHGEFHGESAGIFMEDEESGKITLSLDLIQLKDGILRAGFDARTPICATEEKLSVLEQRLAEAGYALDGHITAPHYVPEDSPFVQTLLKCYEKVTGKEGYCIAIGGGTYVHDV
ncbi:MAG: Sapep family Mn(2+)-dependent dipeptidase, partial [Firmicutes bacterium]|nr:Sapep family Mn(2+)-dependent dipeptidase [Bacillota bacterium]